MMNSMQKDFREDIPKPASSSGGNSEPQEPASTPKNERGLFSRGLNSLLEMGLGESLLKIGTNVFSLIAIAIVIWLVQMFYRQMPGSLGITAAQAQGPTPTAIVDLAEIPPLVNPATVGILREAKIHTNVPTRPRKEIEKYTVQEGDTVFAIAEKFGLEPETILWSNYNTLLDDPHSLQPGQELIILPVNGVYWQWLGGIPFGQWAEFYGVKPEDIINLPANHLDPTAVGDFANANIESGTWLIIPGGKREFVNWSAPLGVTRENPASARVLGPGACDPVSGGAIGYGTYVWPANKHYLSGFDYTPKANHWGIDIAGSEGEGVYAADAGVIVYAGMNNYGYGNMIMIDHGDGFQTLYAHLSAIYRFCGQSVGQGEGIGAIGSTGHSSGPHLHFEIRTLTYFVNPWDYLPPP
jgi:murein DD-endopeptidase MepM/ murein hydrolase activator NlpD